MDTIVFRDDLMIFGLVVMRDLTLLVVEFIYCNLYQPNVTVRTKYPVGCGYTHKAGALKAQE